MYTLVITDYRTIDNTLGYIGKFLENCSDYVDVVVVDNSDVGDGKAYLDENIIVYTKSLFKGFDVYKFEMSGKKLYLIDAANNGGYSKGNNLGVALSDSLFDNAYYIFSNNDVEFQGRFNLARINAIFRKHENVGIIGPKVIAPDGRRQNPRKSMGFISQMILQPYNTMCLGCRLNKWLWNLGDDKMGCCGWVSGSFMIVRRDSFKKIGGFDESVFLYAEEMIISERLRSQGIRTFYEPGLTIIHHHQGAMSNYKSRKQNHISTRYYYGRYLGIREPWLRLSDFCFESAEIIHSIKHKIEDIFRVSINKPWCL
jgi:GT2 family glycosyltransferase